MSGPACLSRGCLKSSASRLGNTTEEAETLQNFTPRFFLTDPTPTGNEPQNWDLLIKGETKLTEAYEITAMETKLKNATYFLVVSTTDITMLIKIT